MITARHLDQSDLDAVVALLHAYDRRWFGEPVLVAEDVAAGWRSPGFDLATDSEGWEDEGALVAFGVLDALGGVELAVREDWAGTGLEAALLDRWEGEARQRGYDSVHRHLAAADLTGQALLVDRGWVVARTGWMLELAAETPVSPRPLPDGYAVRPMVEADVRPVFAVVQDAFAPYSTRHRSFGDWHAGSLARADVTLEHCQVATWRGEVVGACLVMDPLMSKFPQMTRVPTLAPPQT